MSLPSSSQPTPHRIPVDLSKLEGHTVLGESLSVLFSALLRLQFVDQRDGMATMSCTLPNHEAKAIERAMTRSERTIKGDRRTAGQRDCDRLLAVGERVSEVVRAVLSSRATGAA